jgi:hypothetical protein
VEDKRGGFRSKDQSKKQVGNSQETPQCKSGYAKKEGPEPARIPSNRSQIDKYSNRNARCKTKKMKREFRRKHEKYSDEMSLRVNMPQMTQAEMRGIEV